MSVRQLSTFGVRNRNGDRAFAVKLALQRLASISRSAHLGCLLPRQIFLAPRSLHSSCLLRVVLLNLAVESLGVREGFGIDSLKDIPLDEPGDNLVQVEYGRDDGASLARPGFIAVNFRFFVDLLAIRIRLENGYTLSAKRLRQICNLHMAKREEMTNHLLLGSPVQSTDEVEDFADAQEIVTRRHIRLVYRRFPIVFGRVVEEVVLDQDD